MPHCCMCGHDFPDETRMVVPPRESSAICVPCSESPMGRRLMARDDQRYDGYRPGSFVKGDRLRQALRRWTRQPRLKYRDEPVTKK